MVSAGELSAAEAAAESSAIATISAAFTLNAATPATGSRTTEIAIKAANMARAKAMVRMVPDTTRQVHGQVTIFAKLPHQAGTGSLDPRGWTLQRRDGRGRLRS